MFENGYGIPKDLKRAASLYEQAANKGLAQAAYNLGTLYERSGTDLHDPDKSAKWFGKAAALGHKNAQKALKKLDR
jgi:TPR repeat protein